MLVLSELAASERSKKTSPGIGNKLEMSKSIGLSLSPFFSVIQALTNPKTSHIPYRNSKQTILLRQSLGGSHCTLLVTVLGEADTTHPTPDKNQYILSASDIFNENITTLRVAHRVGQIKNRVTASKFTAIG